MTRYALGSTDAEHARLVRQAKWLAPHTERLFREAGIGPGQRVLDLGSGVGDVAVIAAHLVGPAGTVVGVERDARSVARARARMGGEGLRNVTFTQCDVIDVSSDEPFDAVVGRYILMFLPDPVSAVRSASRLVLPGGAVAFQEPEWGCFLDEAARLPLWSTGARLLVETFRRCGTNTELGCMLPRVFEESGLPAPAIRTDRLIGSESWLPDCLWSVRPTMVKLGLSLEALGDFETLSERLRTDVSSLEATAPLPSIVSAWSRKPLLSGADR
jgi:SAM-dependent methyltransferase